MKIIALIPAYKPSKELIQVVEGLLTDSIFEKIICVNDGSGVEYDYIFEQLHQHNVEVLCHAVNLGKGAALKTGFNHIVLNYNDAVGVVTLDADGQHLSKDCNEVAKALSQNPTTLILGTRKFNKNDVPLRSRFGNIMTAKVLNFFTGIKLEDTQTGLRGIPTFFLSHLLKLSASGYEFELDMLILSKEKELQIQEVNIETIYIDDNNSSHFNPFLDSFKIYMVFLRFNFASIITCLIDNLFFCLAIFFQSSLAWAIIIARIIAGSFNYVINKNFVFKYYHKSYNTLFLYISTVAIMGFFSYLLVEASVYLFSINVLFAKICSELLLYMLSFTVQKNIVFKKNKSSMFQNQTNKEYAKTTNWINYYNSGTFFSRLTAKIAFKNFCKLTNPFLEQPGNIIELGGGNSIFYKNYRKFFPSTNIFLLDQCPPTQVFLKTINFDKKVHLKQVNLLLEDDNTLLNSADLVCSFGLIEHFNQADTATMIAKHFSYAKDNALVFISFPTPTKIYNFMRFVLTVLQQWKFHDERPLLFDEVYGQASKYGILLEKSVCHRLGLSQETHVYKKNSAFVH